MINNSYLFMVDVKPNNINENVKNYIVKRMIGDPLLIAKFGASEELMIENDDSESIQ
jgi:hypothetical protein